MEFKIYIEDLEALRALDVVIHNTDGTMEMHRIYNAAEAELKVVEGSDLQ